MLTDQQRSAVYDDMLDLLRRGHVKGALETRSGVCLVGAADRATARLGLGRAASRQVQLEVAAAITAHRPLWRLRAAVYDELGPNGRTATGGGTSGDGGLMVVEGWNDSRWRRARTVVKLVEGLAEKARSDAKDELVAELRALVDQLQLQHAALQARVAELEAENARLREETAFWKGAWQARRTRVAARDLRDASNELTELDDRLDAVLTQLTSAGVV